MSDGAEKTLSPLELLSSGLVEFGLGLGLRILLALLTIVAGLVIARITRRIARSLIDRSGLEALLEKLGVARILYRFGLTAGTAKLGGQLVYWATLAVTLLLVLEQLDIEGLTQATSMLLAFLPKLFVATSMVLLGFICGDYLKSLLLADGEETSGDTDEQEEVSPGDARVEDATSSTSMTRRFLAHLLQWSVVVLSATIALEYIGVAVTLVHGVLKVSYFAITICVAIAFALGARHTTKHVTAGYYARKLLREGDAIQLENGTHGILKAFRSLHVLVQVDEERELLLPYGDLMTQTFTLTFKEDEPDKESL